MEILSGLLPLCRSTVGDLERCLRLSASCVMSRLCSVGVALNYNSDAALALSLDTRCLHLDASGVIVFARHPITPFPWSVKEFCKIFGNNLIRAIVTTTIISKYEEISWEQTAVCGL